MVTGIWTIAVKFAIFALVAALLFILLVNTMGAKVGGDSRSFTAEFTDVSGLRTGDDVKVAGVRVGRVEAIEVGDGVAEVTFDITEDQAMLDSTHIVMRYQNLVGQRYLALVQGKRRGAELEGGSRIPVGRTDPGFDLTALLNGFRPLFEVLQPDDVNELATSMVKVLQGEGGTIEQLLSQTGRLSRFIADRDEVFGQVLENLTPVLDEMAGQGPQLTSTVRELRALMTGLAREREAIGASIDGVSQLVGSTSELLRDLRGPSRETIREFRKVAKLTATTREELNAALRAFRATFTHLGRAGSYENALNVYACTVYVELGGSLVVNVGGGKGPWSEVCQA